MIDDGPTGLTRPLTVALSVICPPNDTSPDAFVAIVGCARTVTFSFAALHGPEIGRLLRSPEYVARQR